MGNILRFKPTIPFNEYMALADKNKEQRKYHLYINGEFVRDLEDKTDAFNYLQMQVDALGGKDCKFISSNRFESYALITEKHRYYIEPVFKP